MNDLITTQASDLSINDYQTGLRAWLADNAGLLAPYRHRTAQQMTPEIVHEQGFQRLLWDAGWTRWGWPENCGGRGGTALHRAALYDTLWGCGFPIPEGMLFADILGPTMVHFAPQLAEQYLAGYLAGNEVWCQAFSEPGAGSDMAAVACRAVEDGDNFIINGQKMWSSQATAAQRTMLLARTGDTASAHRGLTMFFVDLSTPGVEVVPTMAANGRDEFAEIFFDDAVIPRDRIVGVPLQGWAVAMYLLQFERGMYAWQRQAYLTRRLNELIARSDPTTLRFDRVGEAFLALTALRMSARDTIRQLARGDEPGPEISVTKILLGQAEHTVFDVIRELSDQLLEFDDSELGDLLRAEYFYTRASTIYGGSAEIQRNLVADRVLGLPKDVAGGR